MSEEITTKGPWFEWYPALFGTALVLGVALAVIGLAQSDPFPSVASLENTERRLTTAFPNTSFDRFGVEEHTNLHVAESGETIVYSIPGTPYVLIGNIMDLDARIDLTEQRRAELRSVASLEAKTFGLGDIAEPSTAPAPAPARPAPAPSPSTVDVSALDPANMVVSRAGEGTVLYVVSDYNCSFCRRLYNTLAQVNDVEIREIPVGILGPDSRVKGSAVLCSDDPAALASEMFTGAPSQISTCTDGDKGVDANTAWMQASGQTGTPFMFTEDGRVLSGARELAVVQAFLGSRS